MIITITRTTAIKNSILFLKFPSLLTIIRTTTPLHDLLWPILVLITAGNLRIIILGNFLIAILTLITLILQVLTGNLTVNLTVVGVLMGNFTVTTGWSKTRTETTVTEQIDALHHHHQDRDHHHQDHQDTKQELLKILSGGLLKLLSNLLHLATIVLIQDIVPGKNWFRNHDFYHNLDKWSSLLSGKNKDSFTTILGVE